jgi:hypothetical protein
MTSTPDHFDRFAKLKAADDDLRDGEAHVETLTGRRDQALVEALETATSVEVAIGIGLTCEDTNDPDATRRSRKSGANRIRQQGINARARLGLPRSTDRGGRRRRSPASPTVISMGPADQERILDELTGALARSGTHPAFVHAVRKTGFMLTEANMVLLDEKALDAWSIALKEGEDTHGPIGHAD